ncbi:MAG: polynucleotide adenylyltransferase [Puniceicoccales bacterium]|jgi:tRNA nucleotidyltransferase (CCA-adding enzyme)|nr:polynucleotide adenylyltransferase [Puniceicoccales bacterium]
MTLKQIENVPEGVCHVCERIRDAGGRALLVGGCVRDLLLGLAPAEWDVEVFDLASADLESLFPKAMSFVGKGYGIYKFHKLPLDLALPRRETRHGPGHRDFFVEIDRYMSIGEAAHRRDFTINAIYYDPLTCVLEDPFGGCKDLRERRLRHVSDRFSEDPLRVLRGMQFLARFSLRADPLTVKLCRTLSADFLSPERIFAEMRKLFLLGHNIADALAFLDDCDWLRFFPELEALKTCPQNPAFHPEGCVLEHIKHALNAFSTLRPSVEADALAVGFAILCHDFGKPSCTTTDDRGILHAPGHEKAGIIPTRNFLQRLRAPNFLLEIVPAIVSCHMLPRCFSCMGDEAIPVTRRLAWRVKRIDLLLAVARCDNMGRPPIVPNFSGEDRLEQLARTEGILRQPPRPIIRGRDLQSHLDMAPSKKMGEILEELFQAQLDGKFSSAADGLRMAKKLME